MMHRFAARAVASTLIFTLTYTPVLGTLTDSAAMAQTVQNSTTSYGYDALGNMTQVTDPLGHITTLSYDAQNRVIQELQPAAATGAASPSVKYGYDGQSQISTVTDPRSLVTSYVNDGLGNQSALTSPDTGTSGKTYDAAGNLLTSTDALKRVTTYTYDALNRVTSIAYPTTAATKFEYDGGATPTPNAIGHLTKMTDVSGITTYAYDQHGRLITQSQSISRSDGPDVRVTGYAYGTTGASIGKLVGLTYPSGNRIVYDYDTAGRIQSLTLNAPDGSSKVLLSGIGYAPFGPVQSWTWGNDNSTVPSRYVRTFDLDGRVTSYPLGNLAANGLVRTVGYDAAGRVTGYTHTAGANAATPAPAFDQTFGYDNLDRLTSVVTATGGQSYAYDLNGNRTQVAYGANSYAYTISPTSNVLTATAGPLPARAFLYDTTGSLTSDRPIAYTYRDNGRLSSMSKSATESAAYSYNGLGQRVNKRSTVAVGGANTYVYDPAGHLLGEYVAKGAALEETVYLGDQPVAVLVPQGATTAAYYVYADQINTPRVITNANDNAMVWRWDNADPFGVGYPTESPAGATAFVYNLRFPGQLYDRETNTHYNFYRDYDPQTGRYLQSDPIGLEGGINSYQYVDGAPLDSSDPSGLLQVPSGALTRALIRGGGTIMTGGGPENPAADVAAVLVGVGSLIYDIHQATKDDCDCGNLTRTQALALAQAWAEVPRASRTTGADSAVGAGPGRTTIELGRLNKSSQGPNYNQLKANGASGLGYENPLMPTKNYVFDHPDGHDDNDAAHHKCPHIHAYHPIKGDEIFRYKVGTK